MESAAEKPKPRKGHPVSRAGSSKSPVQNLPRRGSGSRPESFRRFQTQSPHQSNNYSDTEGGRGFPQYENLDYFSTPKNVNTYARESESDDDENSMSTNLPYSRRDLKLFPKSTSTNQIFDCENMNSAFDVEGATTGAGFVNKRNKNPSHLYHRASFNSINSSSTGTVSSSEASINSQTNSDSTVIWACSPAATTSSTNPFYVLEFSSQPNFANFGDTDTDSPDSRKVETNPFQSHTQAINPILARTRSNSKDDSEAQQQNQQRRNSSNTRFSEYISSTSSWDWPDGEEDYQDELRDSPFAFLPRQHSRDNDRTKTSGQFVRGYPGQNQNQNQNQGQRQDQGHFNGLISTESTSTATSNDESGNALSGISSASCPSLNTIESMRNLSDEFKKKMRLKSDQKMAVSTTQIDLKGNANTNKKTVHWKSSSCIWSTHSHCPQTHLNRPITLRFLPGGLQESSKVVWCSEKGDFTGTVKWTGKIKESYFAGVEFERQVGNSSGIYGYGHGLQIRLFTCKLGYGRFIPVSELILYEDYYENQKTGFICIICRDDFIEPGSNTSPDGSLDDRSFQSNPKNFMVATKKCGHLFHDHCLTSWFNQKKEILQHCPYCQHPMGRNDTLRIYPAQLK